MIRALLLTCALAATSPTLAHDFWSNGQPVPAWIKSSCCGPADAHHLTPDQVYHKADGNWVVDGYKGIIEASHVIPSQDGDYWVFYACPEATCNVYCFFVPMEF